MPETARTPAFDGVIALTPGAANVVGGLRLVERAAFTLARAGARRLWCCGARPAVPLRLPDVPLIWTADAALDTDGCAEAAPLVIVVADSTITDAATIAALAAAPGPAVLRAPPPALLWRGTPAAASTRDWPAAVEPPSSTPLWQPPAGALLCSAADPLGRQNAERALFAKLGRTGDGWLTRVVDRRLSRALTRQLLPWGVSPNQVTLASIAIGIAGGACFALASPFWSIVGALLFFASTVIDGCDGEIARLTFRESAFGARLDILGDNVVHVFLFGGIATGLYRRSADATVAVLGIALVAGVLLAMATVYWCIVRRPPTRAQQTFFEAFASREFAYLLVALTVAGHLDWFLWLSAVGTYVFAIGLAALGRRSHG